MRELKSLNSKANKQGTLNFTFRLNYDRNKVSFSKEVIKDFAGKFNTIIEDKGVLYLIACSQIDFNRLGKTVPTFIPKPTGEKARLKSSNRSVFLEVYRQLFPQVKNTSIQEFPTAELRMCNEEQTDSVRSLIGNSYGTLSSQMEVYRIVPGKNVKRSASYGKRPEGALAALQNNREDNTPDELLTEKEKEVTTEKTTQTVTF